MITGLGASTFAVFSPPARSDGSGNALRPEDGGVSARPSSDRADASSSSRSTNSTGQNELSEAEQKRLRELQQRDREVRAHEMAHVAAGGNLVLRGASFEYETGPDGQRYAVGGDVIIDTSPGRTPEETVDKAQRIKATALAPAEPSPQDLQVAAQADRMGMEARMELALQAREEPSGGESGQPGSSVGAAPPTSPSSGNDTTNQRMREAYAQGAMAGFPRAGTFSAFA